MIGVRLCVGRDNRWVPYRYVTGDDESQARELARVWCLYGDFPGQRSALLETERGRGIVRLVHCAGQVYEEEVSA